MSIAERNRRKSKKDLEREVNNLNFNCPKCGFPIPLDVFNTPNYGMDYKCTICGCIPFEEFKKN